MTTFTTMTNVCIRRMEQSRVLQCERRANVDNACPPWGYLDHTHTIQDVWNSICKGIPLHDANETGCADLVVLNPL